MMGKITKDMTVMDVVNKYPQSIKVFFEHGLFCIGCNAAYRETVEQGAAAHGINADELITKLNQALPKEEEKK